MDIITLPIEYDKKKIDSRYRLVVIASQRARELSLGSTAKIQVKGKKPTTTAIIEAITDNIEYITGEEAIKAKERSEKIDYRKLIEERRTPITDLSELERDLKIYLHEKASTERALEELFSETEIEEVEKESEE